MFMVAPFGGLLLRTAYRFLALLGSSRKDTMMSISIVRRGDKKRNRYPGGRGETPLRHAA
jgi:hypothetical protein